MTIDTLGNLGEFIGAIGVVVSLIYLAYQIRQNTRQIDQNTQAVRASGVDASISASNTIRQSVFESSDLSRIFDEGMKDPNGLNQEDLLRFRLMMANIFWTFWQIFAQTQFAGLPSSVWEAQCAIIARVMRSPGARWYWDEYRLEFEADFREEVDQIGEKSSRRHIT